jgi:hypothetical protein
VPGDWQDRLREIEKEIFARRPEHAVNPSLERITALVTLLGDPQRAYPVIHLTGTNGKTSTARMTEVLLRARGLRTGLFTSPHLSSVGERIVVDGEPLSGERFVEAYDEIKPYVDLVDATHAVRLSFFEVLVGMAFAVFADAPVDVCVLEVGMGGTWDNTNVADGAVAVVTPARAWSSACSAASWRSAASRSRSGACAATTPTCTCRCSAPTRPATSPARSRRWRRSRPPPARAGPRAWTRPLIRSSCGRRSRP